MIWLQFFNSFKMNISSCISQNTFSFCTEAKIDFFVWAHINYNLPVPRSRRPNVPVRWTLYSIFSIFCQFFVHFIYNFIFLCFVWNSEIGYFIPLGEYWQMFSQSWKVNWHCAVSLSRNQPSLRKEQKRYNYHKMSPIIKLNQPHICDEHEHEHELLHSLISGPSHLE